MSVNTPDATVPTIFSLNSARVAYTDSAAPVSHQIAAEITRQVDDGTIGGTTTVQIRLDRPELGTVNLHLSMTNDVVSIRIVTEDPAAMQIINRQMNDLRQSLSDSGIAFNQCQVLCNPGNGQSSDRNPTTNSSRREKEVIASASRTSRSVVLSIPNVQPCGRLNYVA